jgi:hypothetical protein
MSIDSVKPRDKTHVHLCIGLDVRGNTAWQDGKGTGSMTVSGRDFIVVLVRGHADDHVIYLMELGENTVCFAGDAIYSDGSIGLLNTPTSSLVDYRADIKKLDDRGINTLLPGHGLPRLADGQASMDAAIESLSGMYKLLSKT